MKLCDYLTAKTICLDLKSRQKNEAVAELVELLGDNPAVRDRQEFLGAVFAREIENTTGIGDGVAIPHARTDSVADFVAAVGCSKAGVEFNSVDGKPAKLVILMGIPKRMVREYLKLLAHLSLLLKQKDFVRSVLAAPDAAGILAAFASHEE